MTLRAVPRIAEGHIGFTAGVSRAVAAALRAGEPTWLDNTGRLCRGGDVHRLVSLVEDDGCAGTASADGERWALDTREQGLSIWDRGGDRLLRTIEHRDDETITRMRFSPDGAWLAVGRAGAVELVAVDGEAILVVPVPGQCDDLAFTPSGRTLLVVLGTHLGGPFGDLLPGELRAFDTSTLAPRFRLLAGKDAALLIAPDGSAEALGNAKTAKGLAVAVDDRGALSRLEPGTGPSKLLRAALD